MNQQDQRPKNFLEKIVKTSYANDLKKGHLVVYRDILVRISREPNHVKTGKHGPSKIQAEGHNWLTNSKVEMIIGADELSQLATIKSYTVTIDQLVKDNKKTTAIVLLIVESDDHQSNQGLQILFERFNSRHSLEVSNWDLISQGEFCLLEGWGPYLKLKDANNSLDN